jgi:hypothetical protein
MTHPHFTVPTAILWWYEIDLSRRTRRPKGIDDRCSNRRVALFWIRSGFTWEFDSGSGSLRTNFVFRDGNDESENDQTCE